MRAGRLIRLGQGVPPIGRLSAAPPVVAALSYPSADCEHASCNNGYGVVCGGWEISKGNTVVRIGASWNVLSLSATALSI
jgi:hypothetical protein